jgi:3-deoxy-manno-octulosonate cytidylyltransferase (CMP-KDO synthetase)
LRVVTIIPARMSATRFPNKPMAKIFGIPMVGHCYLRAAMAKRVSATYVATCDKEIADYITSIGGNAVMTSSTHERASDRCAEAIDQIEKLTSQKFDIVAMVQGDEPLVLPEHIDVGIEPFLGNSDLKVSNLMTNLDASRFEDPNEVKVVCDRNDHALYFSREPIPSRKKWHGEVPMLKQLGIIFFRREFLKHYSAMTPTPLEKIESVDMNRVLENGVKIKMVNVDAKLVGVDVPADLIRAEGLMRDDRLYSKYKKFASDAGGR